MRCASHHRHAELDYLRWPDGSASITPQSQVVRVEKWTLKKVLGDDNIMTINYEAA